MHLLPEIHELVEGHIGRFKDAINISAADFPSDGVRAAQRDGSISAQVDDNLTVPENSVNVARLVILRVGAKLDAANPKPAHEPIIT